jgi:hypothetical protein
VSSNQAVQRKPKQSWWVRRWLKDETFWQGIVVQTMGTLTAAVIIALVAIFIRIGDTSAVRYFVIYGSVILLTVLIVLIVIPVLLIRFIDKMTKTGFYKRAPFWIGLLMFLLSLLLIISSLYGAISVVLTLQPVISDWTGYTDGR